MAMDLDAMSVDDDITLNQLKVDLKLFRVAREDGLQLALSDV
jgi:hypothetical protein